MRVPLSYSLLVFAALGFISRAHAAVDPLAAGFANPPPEARLRAYWWWLNGNVTSAAITRDLEEMKAKGFGGALICDADGSAQDGNARAPHGPTFFTSEWRELYKHTVREATRLGLELSLNIQSGWNLGGPMVTPDDAAKKLVWSESVTPGGKLDLPLPQPKSRDGYYRDLFVIAYRAKAVSQTNLPVVSASGQQPGHAVDAAIDGDPATFWVSTAEATGGGPTPQKPAWLQVAFDESAQANRLSIAPRYGYGPRDCELQVSQDGKTFRSVKRFSTIATGVTLVDFDAIRGRIFRLAIFSAFDPRFPEAPRNAQVAEFNLMDGPRSLIATSKRATIQNWEAKAMHRTLHFSAPDTAPLLTDFPVVEGEEETKSAEVVDVTAKMDDKGTLRWNAPEGTWQILRFGCTIGDHSRVSTSSEGWSGFALDVLDEGAFRRYWDAVVEPLIADAGPQAGKTMKYLHTDSWEVEAINWTPTLRDEFRKRRGYDLLPFLPVIAGRIVESRKVSNRFLNDFRKTLGDLAVDNHYKPFLKWAHRHNMEIHPESGGPHASPIDAQRCLGQNDMPMSEFWAWSWRHRVGDSNRFFVKQPASAAHTYGKRLVSAEGFTTIGPHWQETLWDNLKPAFDHASMEGLNRLVWHAFVCSPESEGIPGQQYFAGTHLNPLVTWWDKSGPFFSYLNRCQFMLQRGLFVADVLYYYGDHVPNFAQIRASDPARVGAGYDYDILTEEALLTRVAVRDGQIFFPDGASYRLLVLPERPAISLPVLRKLKELVRAGATIVGPKPSEPTSLTGFAASETEVQEIANELWRDGAPTVLSGKAAREVLLSRSIAPDFEVTGNTNTATIEYIHRRENNADVYFVASRAMEPQSVRCTFRVSGKAPELWDALTGERRFASAYSDANGRTALPLEFGPYGSLFVIFREPAASRPSTGQPNFATFKALQEVPGPWVVGFDQKWGGSNSVSFTKLADWTTRPEPGIKFFSGTATYRSAFTIDDSAAKSSLHLDLGEVREIAEVRLNGKSLGIMWAPPFRIDISSAVKAGSNNLEVDVVNFWPNRVIGDAFLPPDQRLTRTNVRKLTQDTKLMPSGLLGPVSLVTKE